MECMHADQEVWLAMPDDVGHMDASLYRVAACHAMLILYAC